MYCSVAASTACPVLAASGSAPAPRAHDQGVSLDMAQVVELEKLGHGPGWNRLDRDRVNIFVAAVGRQVTYQTKSDLNHAWGDTRIKSRGLRDTQSASDPILAARAGMRDRLGNNQCWSLSRYRYITGVV